MTQVKEFERIKEEKKALYNHLNPLKQEGDLIYITIKNSIEQIKQLQQLVQQ